VNGFTLTVTGTNLISLSTIEWNGTELPTEYVSSSQLQAQVSASDVATAGSVSVDVVTPGPGGGTSTVLFFTVISGSLNLVPSILSLYPDFVPAGSAGFTLSVNGSNLNASSVVEWNGSPRLTSLYSPGQLQVQVSTSDIAHAGYGQITVSNPGPGGGLSNPAEFQVLYQPTIVSQPTNDLIWDPLNQVIYISVPGSAATHANQVCILNPATATIGTCQTVDSEPDVLAISDDSQFLYVGQYDMPDNSCINAIASSSMNAGLPEGAFLIRPAHRFRSASATSLRNDTFVIRNPDQDRIAPRQINQFLTLVLRHMPAYCTRLVGSVIV
jgi:hypothetical protein